MTNATRPLSTPHEERTSSAAARCRPAQLRMAVEVSLVSSSTFFAGPDHDIGDGGLFVDTSVPLPLGAVVPLDLFLEGRRHAVRAEVSWALDGSDGATVGLGVRFLGLPSRTRTAIHAFLGRRAPLRFECLDPSSQPSRTGT